jgi:hypothetical protein
MISNRNSRSNQYARVLVSRHGGDRQDLALQTGLPRDMLKCPIMEDKKHRDHVDSFSEGLEFGVIPYHYEARNGVDALDRFKRG